MTESRYTLDSSKLSFRIAHAERGTPELSAELAKALGIVRKRSLYSGASENYVYLHSPEYAAFREEFREATEKDASSDRTMTDAEFDDYMARSDAFMSKPDTTEMVPDYTSSVESAMSLFHHKTAVTLTFGITNEVSATMRSGSAYGEYASARTPALALCALCCRMLEMGKYDPSEDVMRYRNAIAEESK